VQGRESVVLSLPLLTNYRGRKKLAVLHLEKEKKKSCVED